ncbi:MAG: hypothetical protein J6B50_09365 [Lachnospiraceae bacterium]|nr:hypothetical protein [Lachnospiraceae bacterium]MBP3593967.1 hypothetical protein [Lachnospiraceae bacterium]
MKLKELLQRFCEEHGNYKYCYAVNKVVCDDVDCVGIVVSKGASYMEMLMELTVFLSTEGYTDFACELEGASVASCGKDNVVIYPNVEA